MKVRVTREDIRNGKRSKCRLCPVAIAVGRASGQFGYVDGYNIKIFATKLGRKPTKEWYTPGVVEDFMFSFDEGEKVKPFSFELTDDALICEEV